MGRAVHSRKRAIQPRHQHAERYGTRPDPKQPTAAKPGSKEKILVVARRFARAVNLWHRMDARLDDEGRLRMRNRELP